MNDNNELIILPEDPESAQLKTLELWVDRWGYAYKDKNAAQLAGCTHIRCKGCGKPVIKSSLLCGDCKSKKEQEKFLAMPFLEWDKTTPLCVYNTEQYFFIAEEIEDYCEENEIEISSLNLCVCKQCQGPELDEGFFDDCLPEECELPDELITAINDFNEKVKEYCPISWEQGKYRTAYNKENS